MVDGPAPLHPFLLYHRSMRMGAAALVAALDAGADPRRLRPWFARYRAASAIHAVGEDDVLWPALLVRRPELADVMADLDVEHAALDTSIATVDTLLAEDAPDDLHRAATGLVDRVTSHLALEEAEAVPALVDTFSVDELGDLMRRVQQHSGPDGAAVALPFLLAHADDDERGAVLAALPPAMAASYESSWRREQEELEADVTIRA